MALIGTDLGGSDWASTFAKLAQIGKSLPFSAPTMVNPIAPPAAPAAPPPAAPAAPGQGAGHWQTPNYEALLAGDPTWQAAQATEAANEQTAGQTRAQAIAAALTQFGLVPKGFTDPNGDINAAVRAAAEQNPFSTVKQLQTQQMHGNSDLGASLAARGMLASGALTGGTQAIQTAYDQALSDATNNLLQALGGYESNYATTVGNLKSALQGDRGAAALRIQQGNPAIWITDPNTGQPTPVQPPGSPAPPPPPPGPPAVGPNPGAILTGLVNPPAVPTLPPFNPAVTVLPPPPAFHSPLNFHSFVGI